MQLKMYSAEDMHKATNCFHSDLIIGCTVHCNIYKGTLTDQTAAIKAPREAKTDPEYVDTQEVTAKCDVYNFGVLMLELLTGRQPLVVAREGRDFVDMFVSAMNENSILEMIDKKSMEMGKWDEIQQFIQLALKCVAEKGSQRPNMVEIVSKLWRIRGQKNK